MFDWLGKLVGGIGNLFGGGGQNTGGFSGITSSGPGINVGGTNALGRAMNYGGGMGQGLMGGLNKLFTGGGEAGNFARGAGMMGLSQLIKNPQIPSMPSEYNDYMSMMKGGGTPGMQAANQYYMNVLQGTNKDAYEAASYSLDNNYQEQLRQLNSMYKSLRPGTDPTSDSTYQRDLAQLNDQYARAKAQTMAQVQQGAAQGAAGVGAQQMQGLASGIQAQIDNISAMWGMNASQKEALRNELMGLGRYQITGNRGFSLDDLFRR